MDISLPRVLPPGVNSAALTAADAARTAFPSPRAGGVDAGLSTALGTAQAGQAALGLDGADGTPGAQNVAQSFSALLSQAVRDLNQQQIAADSGAAKLAAGEQVDLHNVMIDMESANLSMGLALQVRNKLLDAYQEVMRMTI